MTICNWPTRALRPGPIGHRLLGMLLRVVLAAIAAALLAAAPAGAQATGPVVPDEAPVCTGVGETVTSCSSGGDVAEDPATEPGTVGPGQVITDPADEIDGPKTSDDSGVKPQERGELHVLPAAAEESSPAPQPSSSAAQATQPVATAPATPAAGSAKTLPFTGVDAGPLALLGALLLAAGLGLRRTLGAAA